MLYIESYDRQSLDRSTNSLIDKFLGQMDDLSKISEYLLSIIQSVFTTLDMISDILSNCKRKLLGNVGQLKVDAHGNGINADSTIKAIENSINAGDALIDEAEDQLKELEENIDCDQTPSCNYCSYDSCHEGTCNYTYEVNCGDSTSDCGEDQVVTTPTTCNNEESKEEDCSYCSYGYRSAAFGAWDESTTDCSVCNHEGCSVNVECSEPGQNAGPVSGCSHSCNYSVDYDVNCIQTVTHNQGCGETTCRHGGGEVVVDPGCNFTCAYSADCHESPWPCEESPSMPEDCTYSCTDGAGCAYHGDDCSYSTTCAQGTADPVCGQTASDLCGEACGETCHMNTAPCEEGRDQGCDDDSDDDSDDDDDCSDDVDCGEGQTCADNCSFDSGSEDGCAEGSCGEGSCGML